MSGKVTSKKASSPRIETDVERWERISDARALFMSSALNMSWQLAITIIVPVFIGVQLDDHFHTSPSYTLAALFLAVFMACGVVIKTLKGVKVTQAEQAVKRKKGKKTSA